MAQRNPNGLDDRQKKFCEEYIVDWNGTRAAKAAGYSEKTATVQASQLLTKLNIQDYIQVCKGKLEQLAGVSKLRNLKELAKIAYSNIASLHDTWIDLADWEKVLRENPECMNAVESIDTKTEYRTYQTDGDPEMETEIKYVKIKLYNKLTAIDKINEMMGYKSPEKINQTNINVDVELTEEQRKEALNKVKKGLSELNDY